MQHNCSCTHNFCYIGFFLEPVETDASLRTLGIGAGILHATSCSCLNKNVRTLEYSKVLTTTPTSGKDTTPFNVRSLTDTKRSPPAHWGVALSLRPPSHFVETLWTSTYYWLRVIDTDMQSVNIGNESAWRHIVNTAKLFYGACHWFIEDEKSTIQHAFTEITEKL